MPSYLTTDPEADPRFVGPPAYLRGGALSQAPMAAPIREPGVLQQSDPGVLSDAPKRPGWRDYVGPAIAMFLSAGMAAPFVAQYFNRKEHQNKLLSDPLYKARYDAELAQYQYLSQHPELAAVSQAGVPAEIQTNEYYRRNPEALEALRTRRQAGGVVRQYVDELGNIIGVFANGEQIVLGQGMASQQGMDRQVQFEGQKGYATGRGTAAGRLAAETAPAAIEGQADLEAAKATAKEQATGNEQQYAVANAALADMRKARALLQRIRDRIASGPETGPIEQWKRMVDPDLQALNAFVQSNVLASYAAAKQQGVTFGSTTEAEWQRVASLGAQLGNYREANLDILDSQIGMLDEQVGETSAKVRRIPKGRGRAPPADAVGPPRKSARDYLEAAGGQ